MALPYTIVMANRATHDRRGTIGLDELRKKRGDILAIAARHGAGNVRVFGSVARNEANSESDIDFLIDVLPVHSSWFPSGLIIDLENLLGVHVDVASERDLHSVIRERVLSEAVPL
jgi:predicted nucleotidyltransferase